MPRSSRRSQESTASRRLTMEEDEDRDDGSNTQLEVQFTQQEPEQSQPIQPVRKNEQTNLEKMREEQRQKALTDLSRLVLFKGLAGEPIDRLKCLKEANISGEKIASAAFAEVNLRLQRNFGFELVRAPKFMEKYKTFPARFKDRYYVINRLEDETSGEHSKAIHSVHVESVLEKGLLSSVEKGLLMVVLAFCYCKGEARSDRSRWILDQDLYRLLHIVDRNIPADAPSTAARRASSTQRLSQHGDVVSTPNVDKLLLRFCELDYLMREKATEENFTSTQNLEEGAMLYTMGPRAAMEIGRRQIIYYCAEILDEEPDPSMLQELGEDEESEEEEDENVEP